MKNICLLLGLMALSFSTPTSAQTVSECDWRSAPENIPAPTEDYTREFSNGKVRVSLIDTEEPASAAMHLMITSPPYDSQGNPSCRIISKSGSLGFRGIMFEDMSADYDPSVGLSLDVPFIIYMPEEEFTNSGKLMITINQATGVITAEQMLAE